MTERHQAETDIKVYSNCDTVTLYINGKKVAKRSPDDIRVCTFKNCRLKKGKNIIKAVGCKGKQKTISEMETVVC